MPAIPDSGVIVTELDAATARLVRLAAIVAVGTERTMRAELTRAAVEVRAEWVEELILQSYLFAGFPRALNAMREWRRISGRRAPGADEGEQFGQVEEWRSRGEVTCARVYGPFYDSLRRNIRELHPALDSWMIVEGYGKVLARPALDLARRELCIVAVCAAAGQTRQLHSHLHGALHAGASRESVTATIEAIGDLLDAESAHDVRALWARVQGQ